MSWKTYTVKEDTDQTVSSYVKERFSLSSRHIQMMFRKKRVKVNSRVAHSKRLLKKGDVITLQLPRDTDYGVEVEMGPLTVLYEDAHTLVVEKPPFMLVHPTGQTTKHTLSNLVAGHYAKQGAVYKIRPVHRLDRDTSGCVLFGKTREAQQYYSEQLQHGHVHRLYRGYVVGCVQEDGVVNEAIGVDPVFDNRRCIDEFGDEAITEYRIIHAADDTTELEFTLLTGRTHQIRVHMAHIGHPIVGDAMYGTRKNPYTRQALHAYALRFVPYEKSDEITITSPVPDCFGQESSPK
ncbi:RluA family pseudouridine synthase [Veillonella agrestimuris]|uniref:RluA family pseudouridine synthase n=1 Tax=Veillonella agrestimuris TaxID=2941340 RepID=UPI00203D8A0E|nr:RluA family pseudouridine synthase [Veillonella agrestimuris]